MNHLGKLLRKNSKLDKILLSSLQAKVVKWYTRYLEVVVGVIPWGFKSPLSQSILYTKQQTS